MFVTYLRTLGIPIAIVGWLLFQIFIKRKKWNEGVFILVSLSSNLLYIAFILYLIATLFFGGAIKSNKEVKASKMKREET